MAPRTGKRRESDLGLTTAEVCFGGFHLHALEPCQSRLANLAFARAALVIRMTSGEFLVLPDQQQSENDKKAAGDENRGSE